MTREEEFWQPFYEMCQEKMRMVREEFVAQFGEERVDIYASDHFRDWGRFRSFLVDNFSTDVLTREGEEELPQDFINALEEFDFDSEDNISFYDLHQNYMECIEELDEDAPWVIPGHPFQYIRDHVINDEEFRNLFIETVCYLAHFSVIVWWPSVTITNEQNQSINIKNLYAKVRAVYSGQICKAHKLNRATYPYIHWYNNYMHSHVSGIPKSEVGLFQPCCLGRGPIKQTIDLLKNPETSTPTNWQIYCWELDKYVHVESLEGVPYHRLVNANNFGEEVLVGTERYTTVRNSLTGTRNSDSRLRHIDQNSLEDFVKYALETMNFKYTFEEGQYAFAHSACELALMFGNALLDYAKGHTMKILPAHSASYTVMAGQALVENLIRDNIILKGYVSPNGKITKNTSLDNVFEGYERINGSEMFQFKGNTVRLELEPFNIESSIVTAYILHPNLMKAICYKILYYINTNFSKNESTYNNPIK